MHNSSSPGPSIALGNIRSLGVCAHSPRHASLGHYHAALLADELERRRPCVHSRLRMVCTARCIIRRKLVRVTSERNTPP
jgi:hypothetical protein